MERWVKKALVLFGAGASVEYKAPSTIGLTTTIEQEVVADSYLQMAGSHTAFQGSCSSPPSIRSVWRCA